MPQALSNFLPHVLPKGPVLAALLAGLVLAAPASDARERQQPTKITKMDKSDKQADRADAQPRTHRLLIQVNQSDPATMNLALNNATNVAEYFRNKGEDTEIEIVAYGPGLAMYRADASPVADRIKDMKDLVFPAKVTFAACGVTKAGMEKKEGKTIELLPEASMVPSGVVRLMEKQEKGWSYVRP